MRRSVVCAAVLLAGVIAAAPLPAQQTPSAQFKTTADLVSVYVTVRDETGRLVTDLTKDDFVVSDNGKTQTLSFFTNDVHPFSVVMMLDRSGSMVEHHELVRDAGKAFVDAMLPADVGRVGSFADEIRMEPPEFTPDHEALVAVLASGLQSSGGSSPVWSAFDTAISALAQRPGRRVLLALTDGYNDPRPGLPITELEDVIRRARYNDILVYIVGFSAAELAMGRPTFSRPSGGGGRPPVGPPSVYPPPTVPLPLPSGGRSTSPLSTKLRPPYRGLRLIADESGGGYYEMGASDDLAATFARIAEELHRQYWMAFAPAKLDSKIHEIEVKVKRRGLDVRARKSYFADPKRGLR
jgi:VWFA-related protein